VAGEYIAVERVENTYKQCDLVEQIWIYGNSFESCLVAVVVPREHQIRALASSAGVANADKETLKVR
jgi:long-chain acyl-CoA synthetase